jgi:transposase-like protein
MNREILQELAEQHLSIGEIASISGCSPTNIRYWLKKFSLKTSTAPEKCRECGETDPEKFYGAKRRICGKCHNKYTIAQGQKKKAYMREKFGNKCAECGFDKFQSALDIHHLDPCKKDVAFNTARGWSYEKIDRELEHCTLLCSNCHRAVHCGELEINGA